MTEQNDAEKISKHEEWKSRKRTMKIANAEWWRNWEIALSLGKIVYLDLGRENLPKDKANHEQFRKHTQRGQNDSTID